MTDHATKQVPSRAIRARRIRFDYPGGVTDHLYVRGDLVMSHAVSMLSAMFPEGEDFFVRSVRHYTDRITDPELKAAVAGFVGQEVTHGREHRALNERLQEMGYPTRRVDRMVKGEFRLAERYLPARLRLAMTAALEHYTASIAEVLLTKPEAQELLGHSEVRPMLLWHALEESEHKAVAFDVYRAVGGGEARRIWSMRFVTAAFVAMVVGNTAVSLAADRASYHPTRLIRSLAALRHSPFLSREVTRTLQLYTRPGFHPDDLNSDELVESWRAELFGTDGELADHVR